MASTLKEIADHMGVSHVTVSHALRGTGRMAEDTRHRIQQTARRMGYRPNAAARTMASRQTHNIGVVIHSLGLQCGGWHAYDTVSGINSIIEPAGYTTCLVQMHDVESGEDGMARVFREQALDGMIVHAALLPRARHHLGELSDSIIWCDAGLQESTNCVWRDEVQAGRLVANAVAEAGYRKALVVSGESHSERPYRHGHQREAGLRDGFERAGVAMQCVRIESGNAAHLQMIIDQMHPDVAVVAADYSHVEPIALMFPSAGWSPGVHFALACCDDRSWFAVHWRNLSRARFNRYKMGQQAANMMLQRMSSHERSVESHIELPAWYPGHVKELSIPPTLVPREKLIGR